MAHEILDFYESLADYYHLILEDWDRSIRPAVPPRVRGSQCGLLGVVTGKSYPLFSGKPSVNSGSFLNLTGSLTMIRRRYVQSSYRE